jgi:PAS domain S-box-containing protein
VDRRRDSVGEDSDSYVFRHCAVSLWKEDISVLRARLAALRAEGVSDLRDYLDRHPDFIREAIHSITVVDVNDATLGLYEAESKEQLFGFLDRTLDPDATASFREPILAIWEGRGGIRVESSALSLTGRRLSLIVTSYIPPDTDPSRLMLVSVVDITDRTRAEERNLRLASLVESSDDAIVGIGMDRLITVWNAGAERVYGYAAAEIIGRPTSLMIPAELEEETRQIRDAVGRGERIEHFETVRRRKDGALIDVSLTLSLIRDSAGRPVGYASVARDITARKAFQAQLMRAQRLESLATLTGGIAHQFNNINTIIMGYLNLLQLEGNLRGTQALYIEEAYKGIQRAVEITDHLLVLAGAPTENRQAVSMAEAVRPLLPRFEARCAAGKVTLRVDLDESAMVHVAVSRLAYIAGSLITNALDAMIDSPVRLLTVRSAHDPRSVSLEVTDTGCGIAADDLSRIFTPFFSTKGEWAAADSPQAGLKGVGLSLAVCHATASDYDGRIEVRSARGAGTTFRLVLPRWTH